MADRESRLKRNHQGLAINADVRTAKLYPEALGETAEVVHQIQQSGSLVRQHDDTDSSDRGGCR